MRLFFEIKDFYPKVEYHKQYQKREVVALPEERKMVQIDSSEIPVSYDKLREGFGRVLVSLYKGKEPDNPRFRHYMVVRRDDQLRGQQGTRVLQEYPGFIKVFYLRNQYRPDMIKFRVYEYDSSNHRTLIEESADWQKAHINL